MLSKRGTVICLGIISYFFCGCGINNIPNVSISDLDSAINAIDFVKDDDKIVEKFNELNGLTFRKNIENFKSDIPEKYNYRNISKKDLNKIISEMKFIDEMDSYYNAAKSNIAEILQKWGYSNVLEKILNKQSDFSDKDFIEFLSSKITKKEDIANLEFNLLTLTIDLVILVKHDSEYQNNKLEIVNKIITAFYKTYDRIFEENAGFNFNLKDVAEAENIKKKIDFNINNETVSINYLNGVNIIAIESYFLQHKATTKKDKAASLKKIYGNGGFGRDDANKALKSNAYNAVLGAFSQKLDEVSEIMRKCLSPVISINKNKIVKDLENNDNLTVLDVKNFLENQNKFFHFDKIAIDNKGKFRLNNQTYGNFFTKSGQGKIQVKDQNSFDDNNKYFDIICSEVGPKTKISKVFQSIAKNYNTVVSKSQKAKKDSSFGTDVNFDVSTIDLGVIKK